MNKTEMIYFARHNKNKCLCIIRLTKSEENEKSGAGEEAKQREQLMDFIEAGVNVKVYKNEYTETRENSDFMRDVKFLYGIEYIICSSIPALGTDIFWIVKLLDLINQKGIKLYVEDFGMTMDDYHMSYKEFIEQFIKDKKYLEYERTQRLKSLKPSATKIGRPIKKLDEDALNATIEQYLDGILSGKSAASQLDISEATFRRRFEEYCKKNNL